MKKVRKTTRTFSYDLNQNPYDYIVGMRNRFKGLDQHWDFLGRNDAKAEAVLLWPPHAKS